VTREDNLLKGDGGKAGWRRGRFGAAEFGAGGKMNLRTKEG